MNSDQTDKNQYNQTYNCACFARDFIVNAEKAGYKGGYVSIEFSDASHAIVCFDTSDKGPVFIEPQNDEIVDLKIGTLYAERTVLEISIFWGGFFSPQTKLVLSLIPLPCFIVFTLEARVISRKKGSRSIC